MPAGAFFVCIAWVAEVRMFIYEKLCSFPHFRTAYNTPKTFELAKTKENQHKTTLTSISVQSGCVRPA